MEIKSVNNESLINKDKNFQIEELLAIVLNNIEQGMVVVGPDYAVLAYNKRLEDLFGLQQGSVAVGNDFRDVLKVWADMTGQTQEILERSLRELDKPGQFG